MLKSKKYNYRIVQNKTSWAVEIVRRVTSKKTTVSKSQDGFSSESEAQEWGEKELKSFMQAQNERNKRQSAKRT